MKICVWWKFWKITSIIFININNSIPKNTIYVINCFRNVSGAAEKTIIRNINRYHSHDQRERKQKQLLVFDDVNNQ